MADRRRGRGRGGDREDSALAALAMQFMGGLFLGASVTTSIIYLFFHKGDDSEPSQQSKQPGATKAGSRQSSVSGQSSGGRQRKGAEPPPAPRARCTCKVAAEIWDEKPYCENE